MQEGLQCCTAALLPQQQRCLTVYLISFGTCQMGKTINPIPEALPCHCFRWSNFRASILPFFLPFFCAEVSAAAFENESVFSNLPVFLFIFFPPLYSSEAVPSPRSREHPRRSGFSWAQERRSVRGAPEQRRLPELPAPLPPPSAPGGRAGQGLAFLFLLLLRRGGEVSGTFWRCRRKRPGGSGGGGAGQRHGQVGPGGPALDRGGAGGRHQREQLALDGAGRDQLVQEEAEGGAGGAGGGGRGRALRDRRPQTRGGRSVLQQPQRETHLLLRVEPAPQLERYSERVW